MGIMVKPHLLAIISALFLLFHGYSQVTVDTIADTIYYNGSIITMKNDAYPDNYVGKAVAVKGGKITWVGAEAKMADFANNSTAYVDLAGLTLMPSFIDGHSHYLNAGFTLAFAPLYSSPDGNASSISDLIANMKVYLWLYRRGLLQIRPS